MHLQNEETDAQNRAKLAELAISLEEKVHLFEIQNAANTKIRLPSLSNEDFYTLKSPNTTFPINHKRFSQNNQINLIQQKLGDHQLTVIAGKETVSVTPSTSFTVQDILKQEYFPPIDLLHFSGNPAE